MNAKCLQTGDECLKALFARYPEVKSCEAAVHSAYEMLRDAFSGGNKIMVCGNGGSAADAEHVVGELMKSFRFKRPVNESFIAAYRETNRQEVPAWLEGALPAISLVSQTALSTAFCNDESAIGLFAQQVYGYGRTGDVLLAISTSGNSSNVVEAAKVSRALEIGVIALTGSSESELSRIADICIRVPRREVFEVQELHLPIYHALCAAIEADFFGGV